MGFLLFAARKLQLKREINNKNYELMVLTSQYNSAQKRVAQFQEQMENAKQMTSVFAQGLQAYANQSAYAQYVDSLRNKQNKTEQEQGLVDRFGNSQLQPSDYQLLSQVSYMGSQAGSSIASAFTTVTDSIFDAANKVQLAQLKAQENSLELRKSSLESEVSLLEEEYKAVKSKEGEAIKDAVPQFGLA